MRHDGILGRQHWQALCEFHILIFKIFSFPKWFWSSFGFPELITSPRYLRTEASRIIRSICFLHDNVFSISVYISNSEKKKEDIPHGFFIVLKWRRELTVFLQVYKQSKLFLFQAIPFDWWRSLQCDWSRLSNTAENRLSLFLSTDQKLQCMNINYGGRCNKE